MTKTATLTSTVSRKLARFCTDESGATAIEYAMVGPGIGAILAATVYGLGGTVKELFTQLEGMFT